MTNNRPTILIYTVNVDNTHMIEEVCAGIEEEGLLYEVKPFYHGSIDELSYMAANESILGTGIGVEGSKLALQMRTLAKGENVFFLENATLNQGRKMGTNAARAVKRVPFLDLDE